MKKLLSFLLVMTAALITNAHVTYIRVIQNQDGTLTWYLSSYHNLNECGHVGAGLDINGVQYPISAEFAGDIATIPGTTVFADDGSGRAHVSYGVVNTPYIPGSLSVNPYSTNQCWAFAVGGNGAFTPPPPPVCTSCPVTGFSNTTGTAIDNGTFCNMTDDQLPVTVTVNHLACASITGDGKFKVIFNSGTGSAVTYGPYSYNTGITTTVSFNVPYGTSNATQVQVLDDDFGTSGCSVTHGLTIPGNLFNGVVETIPPTITAPANVTVNGWCQAAPASAVALGLPTVFDNCGTTNVSNNAPANYPVGNTTVTWTVNDGHGNTATATQVVTVATTTISSTSVVSTPYTVSGQEMQTIYLNFSNTPQTQTVSVTPTSGVGPYTYTWAKSGCSNTTMATVTGANTNAYTFAPSIADICNGNDDNIFTLTATVTDSHGCTGPQTKKINVVNPFVAGGNLQVCHKVAVRGGSLSQALVVTPAQLASHLAHYDGLGNCANFNGNKSIPEVDAAQEVAVYPNPTTGMFVLELSYVKTGGMILVSDIQGRVVATEVLEQTDAVSTKTMDLTKYSKGMYLVSVKDGDFSYHTKVIVQ